MRRPTLGIRKLVLDKRDMGIAVAISERPERLVVGRRPERSAVRVTHQGRDEAVRIPVEYDVPAASGPGLIGRQPDPGFHNRCSRVDA
jgi:hypothetical protein